MHTYLHSNQLSPQEAQIISLPQETQTIPLLGKFLKLSPILLIRAFTVDTLQIHVLVSAGLQRCRLLHWDDVHVYISKYINNKLILSFLIFIYTRFTSNHFAVTVVILIISYHRKPAPSGCYSYHNYHLVPQEARALIKIK